MSKDFRRLINEAGSDDLNHFGGTFQGGYYIQQVPEEFAAFMEKYNNLSINNYLEIGVATAGFTRFFSEHNYLHNIILIDLCEHHNIPFARDKNLEAIQLTGQLHMCCVDSHSEKAKQIVHDLKTIDFVMIDAGHTYDDVKQDFELVKPYLHKDSIILFHDTCICGEIRQFINECVAKELLIVVDEFPGKLGLTVCSVF